MKTILTILFIFVCFGLQAQVKEKWADIDSTQTAKLSINESEAVESIVNYEEISTNITEVVYNDTLLFNDVNIIYTLDSVYATNKLWIWTYTLGK